MDITVLQNLAANNLWGAITPEIMLGVLALALLVIELLFPKQQHQVVPVAALVGLLCVLGNVLATLRVFGDCTATAEYLIVWMRGDHEYAHTRNLHGVRPVS